MGLSSLIAIPFQCCSQKSEKSCSLSIVQLQWPLLCRNALVVYPGRIKAHAVPCKEFK